MSNLRGTHRTGRRGAAVGLLLLVLLGSSAWAGFQQRVPANAPAPAAGEENSFTSNVKLPVDPRSKRKLEMARQYIKSQDWTQAIKLLQSLLDAKEDVFLQEEGKNRRVSIRAEASRLVGALPKEGLQFYEQEYGVPARLLLRQGEATGDPQIFADVALRYLHTEAGAEAAALLGAYHLDQGQYITAALCFERLAERSGGLANLSPLNLYRAALAFERCGNATERDQALAQLESKLGQPGVTPLPPALQKLSARDLRASLTSSSSMPRTSRNANWTMFLGSPDRIAQGEGSLPYLEPRIGYPLDATKSLLDKTGTPEAAKSWLDQAIRKQSVLNYPILPGGYPLAVGDLMVYRSAWGIHAVHVKSGQLRWENSLSGSLVSLASPRSQDYAQFGQWLSYYKDQFPWLFVENTLLGTLSTDQQLVYAIEDTALPPAETQQFQTFPGRGMRGQSQWYYSHNKLVAYDLESEKGVVWEIGSTREQDPFAGTFFLGAPLPLGDKLYCLAETNGEIRLLCLQNQRTWDPAANRFKHRVELAWAQPLGQPNGKITEHPLRRTWTCQLAYSDGILVCPTNLGVVIGVDLLTRSLVWAHAYQVQDTAPANENIGMVLPPGGRRMGGGLPIMVTPEFGGGNFTRPPWSVSAPMIAGGLVVFIAPDAKHIHALSLKDGQEVWRQPLASKAKANDLYLGGLAAERVVVVGQNATRALNLRDGKEAWSVPTGMPAGRGVASGNTYYLPVLTGDAKNPEGGEVWAIDVAKGEVASRSRSKGESPGNLVFHDGELISQSPLKITVYPQLAAKEAEITRRLEANPRDPAGLAQRGELRLYRGLLPEAVADLGQALAQASLEGPQKTRAREKLYDALSELLEKNFSDHEAELPRLEKLIAIEPQTPESDEQKQKRENEQLDRRARYLRLVARGRKGQGKVVAAYDAYLQFSRLGDRLIISPDDATLLVAPEVWAQGQVSELLKQAKPDQVQELKSAFAEAWKKTQAGDLEQLQRFATFYAPLCEEGKEAQLVLAEKLLAAHSHRDASLWLNRAMGDGEPRRAARALDAYARLFTELGELDNAAYYYRLLAKNYPAIVVRDGKTGAQLYEELSTDKRFLPFISGQDTPKRGLMGQVYSRIERTESRRMQNPMVNRLPIWLDPAGPVPPLFDSLRVGLDLARNEVRLVERGADEARRTFPLQGVRLAQMPNSPLTGRYQALGPLLIFAWAGNLYTYDILGGKLLWSQDLLAGYEVSNSPYGGYNTTQVIQENGRFKLITMYGTQEWVGGLGSVSPQGICYTQRERGLVMADPLTGKERWVKTDVPTSMEMFGDGDTLFLVPTKAERRGRSPFAIRTLDGTAITVPEFMRAYDQRQKLAGRHLLLRESDAKTDEVTLRLYDALTGKDAWKVALGEDGVVLSSQDPRAVGGVDTAGNVTVVELETGRNLLRAKVDPSRLKDLASKQPLSLLADAEAWYLFFNLEAPAAKQNQPFLKRAPQGQSGPEVRTVNVHGPAYAFDRRTGQQLWKADLPLQAVVLDQFSELPMVVCACMFQLQMPRGPNPNLGQGFRWFSGAFVLDKRDGKAVEPPFELDNNPYLELRVDVAGGLVELIGANRRVGWQLLGAATP